MPQNSSRAAGRHFLQIPGPTPLPDRVLRAMDTPLIDHRGPEFAKVAKRCLDGIKTIFKTTNPVIIYTATGTGAWEAALVNTLSPGDRVLMVETGQFALQWKNMATRLGLAAEFINRPYLVPRLAAGLRALGLLCIYLSSTFDMLLTGLGNSVRKAQFKLRAPFQNR